MGQDGKGGRVECRGCIDEGEGVGPKRAAALSVALIRTCLVHTVCPHVSVVGNVSTSPHAGHWRRGASMSASVSAVAEVVSKDGSRKGTAAYCEGHRIVDRPIP